MANILIVTDESTDWKDYFPSEKVVTVNEYLTSGAFTESKSMQVINLCKSYKYLSSGYYCSLMAEARGHRVIPKVMTINDLDQQFMLRLKQSHFERHFNDQDEVQAMIYFGRTKVQGLQRVAQQVFEHFMIPVLKACFVRVNGNWQLASLEACAFQSLADEEQDFFGESLELFSQKVWRSKRKSKKFRYDIAMLVDPNEKMPPSDPKALRRFQRAANRIGINMEIIGPNDLARLGEFDGLFIRATTNIANFTYKFAKTAENLGLVVMDDPDSIVKCTNKVFLTELLAVNKVPMPKSAIMRAGATEMLEEAASRIGFPMVLKVPDGAFSIGVVKVKDHQELEIQSAKVFEKSALVLAQEYLPTDFDWRIGVLNRQPIYACKYMMSRGHWQIYQHHDSGRVSSGGFETLDVKMVPKCVLDAATKAANLIGSGIYGVDVKEIDDRAYVIEVNDNPSLDHHIEDALLGDLLYDRIVTEFLRRMQMRGF